MSEYEETLTSYRAEIAALEARARSLREAWSAAGDFEATDRQASRLEEEAHELRIYLPAIMRGRYGPYDDDQDAEPEPEDEPDNGDIE